MAASTAGALGDAGHLGKMMEKAMADAILEANAEGIPTEDHEEIGKRMRAARARVKAEWQAEQDAAAAREKALAER